MDISILSNKNKSSHRTARIKGFPVTETCEDFRKEHFRVNSLFHYLCSQCYAAQHSYVPLLSLRRDSPPKSSPTFFVRPCSSVGRVTVDLIRRSWVRIPPRSKDFFFASCGSLFPFTRANAHWVIHGFKWHYNLHFRVNSLFHYLKLRTSYQAKILRQF